MHPIQHTQNPVFRPANDRATRYRPNRTHTLKYSKQISFSLHTSRYIRKDRCFCFSQKEKKRYGTENDTSLYRNSNTRAGRSPTHRYQMVLSVFICSSFPRAAYYQESSRGQLFGLQSQKGAPQMS